MPATFIKISPSKLELVSHCAAAAARSAPFPFVDSPAARRGRDLHERIELLIRTDGQDFDQVTEDLPEEDKEALRICLEVYRDLIPKGEHIVYLEKKIDIENLGMPTGTPDLAFFDKASGTVAVIDWKFGKGAVPDPIENKQLMAYALGLARILGQQEMAAKQAFLVVVQPCGTKVESYRHANIPASDFTKWESDIQGWVKAARLPNPPANPGYHCRSCFCDAGKQGACPEYKEWKGKVDQAKEEIKVELARAAVSGLQPVVVDSPQVSFPIVVLSEEAVQRALELQKSVMAAVVVDQASADELGLLLQEITKFEAQMEKNRETVKKPVLDLGRKIDDEAKRGLIPLGESKLAAKERLMNWKRAEDAKADALRREEEAKRKAAAEEQAKADKEAEEAAKRATQAKNEEDRKKALADQEAARKRQAEAAATLVQPPAPTPQPVKIAGVSTRSEPEFEVLDFEAMPDTFKMVNETLLKAAIKTNGWGKDKKPGPDYLRIEWVEKASSKGRGK